MIDDSPFKDVDASIGQVLFSDQCGSIFAYGSVKDVSYLSCRGRLRGALLPYGCDKITSGKECVCRNKSLET